ncbi:MAG: metalloregulator ArsR/SmtB family transcription factor [Clostridiales bacterium]|jgi:ArsR family transcriptional regulator|nr:metalloregulator ArsR/SmtB family transcription factor [Clostridiales bacterium]
MEEDNRIAPSDELIYYVADFFKIFGDSTRLKLLCALRGGEMSVGDAAAALGMTQSSVSHQFRVLRQSDVVKFRREGKTVFYSLNDEHVEILLEAGIDHIVHLSDDKHIF